jgi:hypothetical protein
MDLLVLSRATENFEHFDFLCFGLFQPKQNVQLIEL